MALPLTGPMSMSQAAAELGYDEEDISLIDLGGLIGIESGEVIFPTDFYGTAGSTPTVQTNAPSSVGDTGMILNGNITSQGATSITQRGFYFGTNTNYSLNTKHITSGTSTGAYTNTRTGLTAGTTYYINAYAINSAGESVGAQQTQATTGGTVDSGSLFRYGLTTGNNIAHRLIMPTTEEPTTSLRMGYGDTFTVNFWIKAGWNIYLHGQGRYQFMFGWGGNAITSGLQSSVYNQNFRIFFDDQQNRMWIGFLSPDSGGTRRYSQNFWYFHRNAGSPNISTVTGLGGSSNSNTWWSANNRGDTNDNDFTMLTFTVNGNVNGPNNAKFYWNGYNVGTPYYGGAVSSPISSNNGGTPGNDTDIARGLTFLGAPYNQSNATYGGTFNDTAGYLGGNGNTYIDEVSIWDSVLSASDILALWNEGAGGTISTEEQPEGLIAYWNFNSTSQNASPKYSLPIWPDPSENSNKGKMYASGSSGFGSGTNTVSG